jgi:hypothetical protein
MSFDGAAKEYISALSLGLPHYTHLLGLHSCRAALEQQSLSVDLEHVDRAIHEAIRGVQQRLQRAYHSATMSSRKESLYEEVLLACALADVDELGYFAAADVREPMTRIMGKPYDIPQFSQHLKAFCDNSRAAILERTGVPRRYRFRFERPLLQPYVIMLGLVNRLIQRNDVLTLQERRTRRKELDLL